MATINISPTTATFAAAGGQGTITLTDTASASWHDTPQSGDNWAAIREKEGNSWSDWFVFGKNGGGSATVPAASSSALGGIKIGYTQSGKNYPVQLDAENKAFVNVPWQSGSGGSSVSVTQGTIQTSTYGTLVGTITVDGSDTDLYAPKVTVTQGSLSSGILVGKIKVGNANEISLYAPDGGSGTAGVSSWAGLSGTISLSQAVDALDESFLKLSGGTLTGMLTVTPAEGNNAGIEISTNSNSFYGNQALKFVNDSQTQRIRGYIEGTTNGWIGIYARSGLWLSPGYSHTNGMTLDTTGLYPVTAGTLVIDSTTGAKSSDGNGRDLGTSSAPFRALHSKVIYLDGGAYIYYDTVNGCIRTNAPIVSDSYISAGGVQST